MVGYVTQLSVCFEHLFPYRKINYPFENFTDLFGSFRIQLLLLLRCWAGPDGDANVSPQKPILLQGHERSITQIKYNREGDLLFSVAKDTVSRTADLAFIHTNVFWDELILGVSCDVCPWRWPMSGTLSMVRGLELIMVTRELFGVSTVTVSFNKLRLRCLFETEYVCARCPQWCHLLFL